MIFNSVGQKTTVFVPGKPVPQGSAKAFSVAGKARVVAGNAATLNPWRADIHAAVRAVTDGRIVYPVEPVALTLGFVMPRAKAERKTTRPHTRRPDLDKCVRAVADALTNLVYCDDSQLVEVHAWKRTADIGEQPGVEIGWESA